MFTVYIITKLIAIACENLPFLENLYSSSENKYGGRDDPRDPINSRFGVITILQCLLANFLIFTKLIVRKLYRTINTYNRNMLILL